MQKTLLTGLTIGMAALATRSDGATRSLPAAADNTIFSELSALDQHLSNGAGPHMYVGTNRMGKFRRGLLRFEFAPQIPVGSTVSSAELTLNLSQVAVTGPMQVAVHRLTGDWGEGASNSGSPGGSGAPATTGDATWVHRRFDTDLWANQGGDFDATATTTATPADIGLLTFSGLAADVQGWLDGDGPNHGWLLKLSNETVLQSALRFDSRENLDPLVQPRLQLTFRAGGDTNGDDLVDIGDFAVLAANFNQPLTGPDNGDFNRDGIVDIADFAVLAANFNQDFGRSAVPEPGAIALVPGLALLLRRSRRRPI